ncbi:Protein-tyrosine sulfotransferase 1 [Clonorchis sinensis]|uniref:Protein-tyrosine sulfotransferase n=1 Tax=Clonorchis sinensis TaxID=79923 RepID=A0A8T1N0B7_CLOSI|nr:Protein-tyrosine sulfotransferase 1 [Clonorchis sinensis]
MGRLARELSDSFYRNVPKYGKITNRLPDYLSRHTYQKCFGRCCIVCCTFMCLGYIAILRSQPSVILQDYEVQPRDQALVFIGGHPRSGTTLLRIMLDVHPMIRCGPETHVLPALLTMVKKFEEGFQKRRLEAAHLFPDPLYRASSAFVSSLIDAAGSPAPVLCNKDPLTLQHISRLRMMFPKAKFIHIVRDGRAVTNSMIKRKIRMSGNSTDPQKLFTRWERIVRDVDQQCSDTDTCFTVLYEDLVLRPNGTMHKLLSFLDVPWDPVVLHHETAMINETLVNSMEPSSTQVVHPVHTEALSSWASNSSTLPRTFIQRAHLDSDMLRKFGYADRGIPPYYGKAEPEIERQTKQLRKDENFLKVFS